MIVWFSGLGSDSGVPAAGRGLALRLRLRLRRRRRRRRGRTALKACRSLLPCFALNSILRAGWPADLLTDLLTSARGTPGWTRSPLRAGFAGLCGPSRLGKSFFLECYCVVLHWGCRYARLCTAQVVPHREPLVSRCKMSNESTVRQAASTAPRCRDESEARAHAGACARMD